MALPNCCPASASASSSPPRVANPGCHATGFLSTVAPPDRAGGAAQDYPLSCYSLTGYSGGGKKMIVEYEAPTGTLC